MSSFQKAFTLIELLVVIAIIAVLAVVVVLTLNPAQLLAQSRDANRVSDMATLNSAIGLYQTDTGGTGIMGSSSVVYVSLPDNASSTCGSLGLAALPSSTIYDCSTATSTRSINNQGWIPLDFTKISSGAPFGSLPIDPVNQSSSGLYYSYVASGTSYMVTAIPESQKQKVSLGTKPMVPNYPDVIANGSSLTINPLYNSSGLVGYWPMDEGVGSSTQDLSGNNNGGTWGGIPAGANNTYYAAGKVGSYAGSFNGNDNFINIGNNPSLNITSVITITAWVNQTAWTSYPSIVSKGYATTGGYDMHVRNDNSIWFEMDESNGTRHFYDPTTLKIANGIWTFLAVTYDGSAQRVYINGQQNGPGQIVTFTAGTTSTAALLGAGGSGSGFLGAIDDVRIYNRALSAAEIQAMYNAEK